MKAEEEEGQRLVTTIDVSSGIIELGRSIPALRDKIESSLTEWFQGIAWWWHSTPWWERITTIVTTPVLLPLYLAIVVFPYYLVFWMFDGDDW